MAAIECNEEERRLGRALWDSAFVGNTADVQALQTDNPHLVDWKHKVSVLLTLDTRQCRIALFSLCLCMRENRAVYILG